GARGSGVSPHGAGNPAGHLLREGAPAGDRERCDRGCSTSASGSASSCDAAAAFDCNTGDRGERRRCGGTADDRGGGGRSVAVPGAGTSGRRRGGGGRTSTADGTDGTRRGRRGRCPC